MLQSLSCELMSIKMCSEYLFEAISLPYWYNVTITFILGRLEIVDNEHLKILRLELHRKYKTAELDGFSLYL